MSVALARYWCGGVIESEQSVFIDGLDLLTLRVNADQILPSCAKDVHRLLTPGFSFCSTEFKVRTVTVPFDTLRGLTLLHQLLDELRVAERPLLVPELVPGKADVRDLFYLDGGTESLAVRWSLGIPRVGAYKGCKALLDSLHSLFRWAVEERIGISTEWLESRDARKHRSQVKKLEWSI